MSGDLFLPVLLVDVLRGLGYALRRCIHHVGRLSRLFRIVADDRTVFLLPCLYAFAWLGELDSPLRFFEGAEVGNGERFRAGAV